MLTSLLLPMGDAESPLDSRDPAWVTNLEETVNDNFKIVTDISGDIIFFSIPFTDIPFVVLWLVVAAIVITFYLGFIQVRGLRTSFDVIRGKYSSKDDPGEIPHYQALTSALSGTVGLGNIAGVGAAVTMGGPGATFWMILAGLFGMATKFAECTLGVRYREIRPDGTVSGGPFKYLPVAFTRFPRPISVFLTGLFAVAILFFGVGGGNMFQSNQTYSQIVTVLDSDGTGFLSSTTGGLVVGLIIAALVGLVIIGGMRSIGRTTATLVPLMGGIYVLACVFVILTNAPQIPGAIAGIFTGAFTPEGVMGGFLGVIVVGMTRAAFSNEAGLGSAPIAHSTVKTRRPVSEGFVAIFEPFIDTVVICTMTALTISIANTDFYNDQRQLYLDSEGEHGLSGVQITSDAFGAQISWFPPVLALAVALFAISTLITWSYYGQRAWNYLFGDTPRSTLVYRVVFLLFTVMGCILTFTSVLDFADNFLFVCAFVNLLAVYLLLPTVKREMQQYVADRKAGTLDQLGVEDAQKDARLEEIADPTQLVDAEGRNAAQLGASPDELREGVTAPTAGMPQDDPHDDGFGLGTATMPYPPPPGVQRRLRARRPGQGPGRRTDPGTDPGPDDGPR